MPLHENSTEVDPSRVPVAHVQEALESSEGDFALEGEMRLFDKIEEVAVPDVHLDDAQADRLRKLGEDVTRTLDVVPRQWRAIETVREKSSCRDCETISQAPAPFHAIAREWARPSLLP